MGNTQCGCKDMTTQQNMSSDVKAADCAGELQKYSNFTPQIKERELLQAVSDGHLMKASLLRLSGAETNLRDEKTVTTLAYAQEMGYTGCFAVLLQAGTGPEGQILQHLMRSGKSVNTPLANGYTPLHEACRIGHLQLIRFLLCNGANIEAKTGLKSDDGNTPLMMALFWDQVDAADLLLKRGAHLETRGFEKRTVLLAVARSRVVSVGFALDRGANIEARDNRGRSALMIAASCGRADIVELLLARGADIQASDNRGRTALHLAAEDPSTGQLEVLNTLLAAHADIDSRDSRGRTPLIAAASAWEPLIAYRLIELGAKVNATDIDGRTALIAAAGAEQEPGIALNAVLIDAEANIHARDKEGWTALDVAECERNMEVAAMLREAGASRAHDQPHAFYPRPWDPLQAMLNRHAAKSKLHNRQEPVSA